jgi:CHAD domain-containing protein
MADPDGAEAISLAQCAETVLKQRLEVMLSHAARVRLGADIEAVHDMRVASRRLRAAVSVFGEQFPSSAFVKFATEVRLVTRALGTARDLDVMIGSLEALANAQPTKRQAGIMALVAAKRTERRRQQKAVGAALVRLEKRDLPALLAVISAGLAPRPPAEAEPSEPAPAEEAAHA